MSELTRENFVNSAQKLVVVIRETILAVVCGSMALFLGDVVILCATGMLQERIIEVILFLSGAGGSVVSFLLRHRR